MLIKITLTLVVIAFVLETLGHLYTASLDTMDKLRFACKKFTKGENIFLYIITIINILAFIMFVITAIYVIFTYL
ncbi:hypothetical protein DWV75_02555 [Ruminococcus sp. AF12-5]|nr:hypothetical protein DWV75_02555 [Ruminococcus sp. AF12-5]